MLFVYMRVCILQIVSKSSFILTLLIQLFYAIECISFLSVCKNYTRTQWFKAVKIYNLKVSMSQAPEPSIARSSASKSLTMLQLKDLQGLPFYPKAQSEKDPFPNSLSWLLAGFSPLKAIVLRASGPCWLLARGLL